MTERARARILVSGRVQGVGYRAFAQRAGVKLGLCGLVRNLPDGRVEVEAEGVKETVEQLIGHLKLGPSLARVSDVQVTWEATSGRESGFTIGL